MRRDRSRFGDQGPPAAEHATATAPSPGGTVGEAAPASPSTGAIRSARSADLTQAAERAASLMQNARAPATRRAYGCDWKDFERWCRDALRDPLGDDVTTVLYYLAARSQTLKTSTLKRRVAAIRATRRARGAPIDAWMPEINQLMAGVRQEHGNDRTPKIATRIEDVEQIIDAIPMTVAGLRDRALVLVTFFGALRSAEVVALNWRDITLFEDETAIELNLTRSKGQVPDKKASVVVPGRPGSRLCPIDALEAWRAALAPTSRAEPIFYSFTPAGRPSDRRLDRESVKTILRRHVRAVAERRGLSAEAIETLLASVGSHSLRAGLITSAAGAGLTAEDIIRHTRHRRLETLNGYIRRIDPLERHPARLIGR